MLRKREGVKRTRLSSTLCVRLHPSAGGNKNLLTGDFCCRRLFILPGLGCCRGQVLGIKVCFDLLGQLQPGLVLRVGVGVHQDRCRRMACVALNRLEVTVRLQELVGGTGVPQAVEYDLFKLRVLGSPQEVLSYTGCGWTFWFYEVIAGYPMQTVMRFSRCGFDLAIKNRHTTT